MKLKIIQRGWEGYNGILGTLTFKDGMSVDDVTQREADSFGVILRCAIVDERGDEVVFSANDELARVAKIRIEPTEKPKTVAQMKAENPEPSPEQQETPAPNPMPADAPAPEKTFTREELEAIADEKGIKGLREIGTPLGAKNTSIGKLIDEILQAQAAKAKS